ncbi:MAG: hypothetical protein H7841_10620 [Magnetospirillum sp. WYHS-4]
MWEFFDTKLTMPAAVIFGLLLGLAPFYPEPHIWEKLKMLAAGTLKRPIDIFDLAWHSLGFLLIAVKAWRDYIVHGS